MTSPAQINDLAQPSSGTTNNPRHTHENNNLASSTMSFYSDEQGPSRPQMDKRSTSELNVHTRSPHRRHKVPRHGEHEWSVFEQVMEDGGQLRSANSTQRLRSKSKRTGLNISLPEAPYPESMLGDSSVVQSPVQETPITPITPATAIYNSDSESEAETEGSVDTRDNQDKRWLPCIRIPDMPLLYRSILKCAIAYFIASLFTYVTPLSHLIGSITSEGDKMPNPSGHMVATIAVYYNPARTMGAMFEANLYCVYGVAWSAFVGLGSMYMFWWIDVQPGWEWLADTTVVIWIGLGMTAVAWMKVWMAKPTFNTACSMTTIILFVVVVKEGGLTTLLQVARIVFTGALITNCVCYLIWPQTASENLKNDMSRTLDSFATLLELLTHTFMLDDESGISSASQGHLQRAVSAHQASFTGLKKSLSEARGEWMLGGKRAAQAYDDAVGCMNRLAQHINGLRSGTRLQNELVQAAREGRVYIGSDLRDAINKGTLASPINERSSEGPDLQTAALIFGELVDEIGPPLNALSSACTDALRRLRKGFAKRHDIGNSDAQKFIRLTEQVQRALFTFESTSNQALIRVYRRSNLLVSESFSTASEQFSLFNSSTELDNENELLTHSGADETVFLVYFFIFTLQEFAKELTALSDAMYRIYIIEHVASQQTWWKRATRVFSLWREKLPNSPIIGKPKRRRPTLKKRISTLITNTTQRRPLVFPKVRPHAPNTLLTPSRENLSFTQRIGQSIWRLNERMKENHTKYALKAGMATALLASPAFFDKTRPLFVEYKGEWALISFFVVISPTIGATNFMSLHRILGTILGAAFATLVYSLFEDNPVALSLIGFFFSLPCFYYIVSMPQYASSGRFVLLTYNLTCLYCYNTRQKDIPVYEIAYDRSLSVIIGVLYAFIVSRLWWPAEARRELGKALSEFCLNIGWLYTHLVAANSGIIVSLNSPEAYLMDDAHDAVNGVERHDRQHPSPNSSTDSPTEISRLLSSPLSERLNESIQTFMAMELHLQIKLLELQNLLSQTQHEPRLKGPFPVKMYRSILTSLQTILDRLHSMRCVTTREEWFTSVKQDFVIPVNSERREMVGNVILYFSVLSAAFKLKTPLPPYLPPAEKSRQRLVDAIRKLDIVKNRDVKGSRQLLFFAYALTMKGVIQELDILGKTLQGAFGVIGQTTEEFEAMFRSV